MRNMETITTSCHGESLGISLRIGIGSMGVTFAGNVAWIQFHLKAPKNIVILQRLCTKVGWCILTVSIQRTFVDNITSFYTSGRKCNFLNKGCDAAALQPVNINGWFWADGNKKIPPTNIPSRRTFWSAKGDSGKRQPDNFTGLKAGKLQNVKDKSGLTVEGLQEFYDEACLAVLNNKYNDGIQWHDVPCYLRSKIICEDSDLQMERLRKENGVDVTIPLTDVSPRVQLLAYL